MKLGLVGWDVCTGLGQYNADLVRQLGAMKWLVPQHPYYEAPEQLPSEIRVRTSVSPDRESLLEFLDGLEWLLFVETPYVLGLPPLARQLGVRIAAIPMVENFDPRSGWVPLVDLMLPPTHQCAALMKTPKKEVGFHWRLAHVRGAVDTNRFAFRERGACQRFLFCNGHGGYAGRKGARWIAEAARLAPDIPILFHSQTGDLPALPKNVEVRAHTEFPEELYADGDVCIQPSRSDG